MYGLTKIAVVVVCAIASVAALLCVSLDATSAVDADAVPNSVPDAAALLGAQVRKDLGNTLRRFETLYQDDCLSSSNKQYFLCMQGDGVLAVVDDKRAHHSNYFASDPPQSNMSPPYRAYFQDDGNLVVLNSGGGLVWAYGVIKCADSVVLSDDGKLNFYNGQIEWNQPRDADRMPIPDDLYSCNNY